MTCADLEELSGAYVLGAVTDEERKEVEEHLAQCPHCTQLVQELHPVVDLLPLTAPQVEPPSDLKKRVLAAIQEEAELRRLAAVATPSSSQVVQAKTIPVPQRRLAGRRSLLIPFVAAAAILLFVLSGALVAWNISLQHQIALLQTSTATTVTSPMQGTGSAASATGELIYFPKQHITIMVIHGLPAQRTKVYQGWLLKDGHPTSIGLLNSQDDTAMATFDGDATSYDIAAVSVERGPGPTANAPQGQIVAVGAVKKT